MQSVQEKQKPIDAALVNELIAITPEDWARIELHISCPRPPCTNDIEVEIHGPPNSLDLVSATPDLCTYAAQLIELLRSAGGELERAAYVVELKTDGTWRYKAHFNYHE